MAKKPANMLMGMKEIANYTGRDRATVMKWIKSENFPAAKVDGRWESNTDLIDDYQRRRIEQAVNGMPGVPAGAAR